MSNITITPLNDNPIRITPVGDTSIPIRAVVGVPGRQGPPAANLDFTQSTPSDTWTISHNLGFFPSVTVFSTGGATVLASITHLSLNTLTINFVTPIAGKAHIN